MWLAECIWNGPIDIYLLITFYPNILRKKYYFRVFLHLINYLEGIIWFQDYDHDVPLTASSLICFDTKLHLIQSWPWPHSIMGRWHSTPSSPLSLFNKQKIWLFVPGVEVKRDIHPFNFNIMQSRIIQTTSSLTCTLYNRQKYYCYNQNTK